MRSKILKEILERIENWTEERQNDAARVLIELEQEDSDSYHLTDQQVAEVERRRTNSNRCFVALDEARERFASRYS